MGPRMANTIWCFILSRPNQSLEFAPALLVPLPDGLCVIHKNTQ